MPRISFLLASCLMIAGTFAFSYEGPRPLRNIKVDATVKFNPLSDFYSYNYKITNPSSNDGEITQINIFISTDPSKDADLVANGLSHCPHFMRSGVKFALQKRPMVLVGSHAPQNWDCGYALLADYHDGSYMWGAKSNTSIAPGTSLDGFSLISQGLPGIRDILIEPDIDTDRLPPEYEENLPKTVALENSVKWMGKTVGPMAPPKVFNASAFIEYLISVKEQSFTLGWIDNQGVKKSLDTKLDQVSAKIKDGNNKAAKKTLNEFLYEVTTHKDKHLTPEAYALLYYDGQYLINHL